MKTISPFVTALTISSLGLLLLGGCVAQKPAEEDKATTVVDNSAQPAPGPVNVAEMKGQRAPAFSIQDLSGAVRSNETLKGKVVLIDFWASWCAPCRAASPSVQKLSEEFKDRDVVVIGANCDQSNSKEIAASYAKEHSYTYTMGVDASPILQRWGVNGIPFFIVIAKDGTIREIVGGWGEGAEDTLRGAIIAALNS